MQLTSLRLSQTRGIEQAELSFTPGMNLLVGINGVGKTTVLDTLRILLSRVLPWFTISKQRPLSFDLDDIMVGRDALTAELFFEARETEFTCVAHLPRERYNPEVGQGGEVREQAYDLAEFYDVSAYGETITKSLATGATQSLAIYFSTRRSVPRMSSPSKRSTAGGQVAAFAKALDHRELQLREFAEWWLVQEALAKEPETVLPQRYLAAWETAATRFLEGYANLRAVREPAPTLLVDKKGTGMTLDVRQLSDGERGVLSVVLDLAQRLAQANPGLEDPLRDGQAVVLIDELDLHLHPRWQRTIVDKLTETFPACQFIATTHSPQIVGEVKPEHIILLESGQAPRRPDRSRGMDSNWVLQFLMGTEERNSETGRRLDTISDLIEDEQYAEAAAEINRLRADIGDFPDLVMLQARLDRLQILGL